MQKKNASLKYLVTMLNQDNTVVKYTHLSAHIVFMVLLADDNFSADGRLDI